MKYFIAIALLLTLLVCKAAVYIQKDNNHTTYSDTPLQDNSQKITVSGVNTTAEQVATPTTTTTKTSSAPQKKNSEKKSYTVFAIQSPTNQDTIQNQPVISVDIQIEPALQPGDKIQLFLDGQKQGTPSESTHLELTQVDRGTHFLYAEVIDETDQATKRTNTITIYVHQTHT